MRIAFPLTLVLAVGCAKPAVEAPAELAELSRFLFLHALDDEPAELEAAVENLIPQILTDDFDAEPRDRAVALPVLKGRFLGDLSIPEGVDAEKQVPRGLSGVSTSSIDELREAITIPNRVCLDSDTTVWAMREFTTDAGCWDSGACDRLEAVQETRKENPIAKVWYDLFISARTLELIDDEEDTVTQAIVTRGWIEEQFVGDSQGDTWDQLFYVEVLVENGANESLRWTGYWSSIDLALIGDDAYGILVADGLAQSAQWTDDYVSTGGPSADCELDINAEKPDRE